MQTDGVDMDGDTDQVSSHSDQNNQASRSPTHNRKIDYNSLPAPAKIAVNITNAPPNHNSQPTHIPNATDDTKLIDSKAGKQQNISALFPEHDDQQSMSMAVEQHVMIVQACPTIKLPVKLPVHNGQSNQSSQDKQGEPTVARLKDNQPCPSETPNNEDSQQCEVANEETLLKEGVTTEEPTTARLEDNQPGEGDLQCEVANEDDCRATDDANFRSLSGDTDLSYDDNDICPKHEPDSIDSQYETVADDIQRNADSESPGSSMGSPLTAPPINNPIQSRLEDNQPGEGDQQCEVANEETLLKEGVTVEEPTTARLEDNQPGEGDQQCEVANEETLLKEGVTVEEPTTARLEDNQPGEGDLQCEVANEETLLKEGVTTEESTTARLEDNQPGEGDLQCEVANEDDCRATDDANFRSVSGDTDFEIVLTTGNLSLSSLSSGHDSVPGSSMGCPSINNPIQSTTEAGNKSESPITVGDKYEHKAEALNGVTIDGETEQMSSDSDQNVSNIGIAAEKQNREKKIEINTEHGENDKVSGQRYRPDGTEQDGMANSADPDQTVWMHRLIWIYTSDKHISPISPVTATYYHVVTTTTSAETYRIPPVQILILELVDFTESTG